MRIRVVLAVSLLACNLFAQVVADGTGWGIASVGRDYEALKKALRSEGYALRYKLGAGSGEETLYGKRFGATAPAKSKNPAKEFRVFSEKWAGRVWDLYITLKGVDARAIQQELTQRLGAPEGSNGDNVVWRTQKLVVNGHFQGSGASLHFLDSGVNERIIRQQLIDQGLEKE